ncbi:PD-(D/E)XK nuclease family protein [Bdellovibrionota bacterium FG-1]
MENTLTYANQLPILKLQGLRPKAWLCVGDGFSREDIKAVLLSGGAGLTGDAITHLEGIAQRIVGGWAQSENQDSLAPQILQSPTRQEILRLLLAQKKILAQMPELKRLRRQASFFRRLDLAMQAGRMAFAHAEEGAVFHERLTQILGVNPIREEIQMLSLAYEAWLEANRWFDPPLLIRRATEALIEKGWPPNQARPQEIHVFSVRPEESLVRAFWEAVSATVSVIRPVLPATESLPAGGPWEWERWHTLDDAADALADRLLEYAGTEPLSDCAVLIPDLPGIRRSLRRALEQRGLPLADPRDPTRLRWDEGLKWALLPLDVVARVYERQKVVSYLRTHLLQKEAQERFSAWVFEIHSRGIRQGLGAYAGGALSEVHGFLRELDDRFGGRKTCSELSEAHLHFLRSALSISAGGSAGDSVEKHWIVPFFEGFWKDLCADMERLDQGQKRAPLLFWWERLQARLVEATPPAERLKVHSGVALYRLQQAPLSSASLVYVFGLPAHWLSAEGVGDYWFSERDRGVLAVEFGVRSGIELRQERLTVLSEWLGSAKKVVFLDATYDGDGRERESIDSVLRELSSTLGWPSETVPELPLEKGAHFRWLASYNAARPVQPLKLALPAIVAPELTATVLESYSRCGLQALAYHRWKLRDTRDPDPEAWPDARGNILHEAVKILIRARGSDGSFDVLPAQALEEAWKIRLPKGLIRSLRSERYLKSRMVKVLEIFCEKEREYVARAPSHVVSLDDTKLRLDLGVASVVGIPDRIDEHPEGLFVMDYKTSSALPNGTDMLELGYRLQLPFYALAARQQLGKSVLGVQFVELNRKGGRGNGVFFKRYNGKEAGKLTCLRANSKSLLNLEPLDVWARMETSIHTHVLDYISGHFEARPKRREKECAHCGIADLCGFRRLGEEAVNE